MKPYAEDEKRYAVMAYITQGENFQAASRQTGIPWETIRAWRENNADWWQRVTDECWSLYEEQIKSGYAEVINKSIGQMLDRVEHGDIVVDKNGEQSRHPIKGRDLATIAGICQDKLNIVRGRPTSISGKVETVGDRLAELRGKAQESGLKVVSSG